MDINFFFIIIVLIMSVVIHEVSHGYVAEALGDPTPRLQGRLTLNPIKHLDLFGSIILPTLSYFLGGFIFGWAKPVVINPYNLKGGKWGEPMVALAGPVSNLLIAIIFGRLVHYAGSLGLSQSFVDISLIIVNLNLVLAVFNMIPMPPLDGSKLLFAVLPQAAWKIRAFFDQYGLIVVIILLSFIGAIVSPAVHFLANLII